LENLDDDNDDDDDDDGNNNRGWEMSDAFPIQNGLKQGDALSPLLLDFALEYAIRKDWN
jgi:hypothetical protein